MLKQIREYQFRVNFDYFGYFRARNKSILGKKWQKLGQKIENRNLWDWFDLI